ncbi:MAG: sigma-54-dependent Fis family transcriptional regulator [Spirochaetales bacterium]|nr:sigma-54-dependent Fis family transcriptional regulator [Spirochaetales bacterium]
MNILLIDDEKECCDALQFFIQNIGEYTIFTSYDSINALKILKENNIDLVFADVSMPALDGVELTKIIKSWEKDIEVVLISGKKDVIDSINAIDYGAFDFIPKPASGKKVENIIRKIELQKRQKAKNQSFDLLTIPDNKVIDLEELNSLYDTLYFKNIGYVGLYSQDIKNICNKLKKLSDYPDIPVMLEGNTGVGKEVFARYLHYISPRAKEPFVAINCATIGKDIFEAELFGYEKGAFTGADPKGKEGKIKLAENGTLFLDEITEIPLSHQSKLLRVMQEKEYYKVSGVTKQTVNTSIVCATNKNIKELVNQGLFREDLYYRLTVCKILIPPLEQRKNEIIPLTLLFLKELNEKNKIKITGIEAKFFKYLMNYNWPGNIRELKNIITKIVLFNESEILKAKELTLLPVLEAGKQHVIDIYNFSLPEDGLDLELYINKIIIKALDKYNGNKTKTASYLNIQRKKLYHKYKV